MNLGYGHAHEFTHPWNCACNLRDCHASGWTGGLIRACRERNWLGLSPGKSDDAPIRAYIYSDTSLDLTTNAGNARHRRRGSPGRGCIIVPDGGDRPSAILRLPHHDFRFCMYALQSGHCRALYLRTRHPDGLPLHSALAASPPPPRKHLLIREHYHIIALRLRSLRLFG